MVKLIGKHILLGVSGGIAAYKIPELIRGLRERGATVQVVMTDAAKYFITPLTLEIVSGSPVFNALLNYTSESEMPHIKLAKWADLIILAPATADLLARLSIGMANDLLTTICLAADAKIAVVPSMNQQMYRANITQKNIKILKEHNILVWGPDEGKQACGDFGPGRMLEPLSIIELAENSLSYKKDMLKLHLAITAGPTQEDIDPIRFITNHSSGKMGYSIAQAAAERGAEVTLISGPVNLSTPKGVKRINIISALDMYKQVHDIIHHQEIFIGCAAVADYRPKEVIKEKIKKHKDEINITFIKNIDIIASVAKLIKNRPYVVGFAAETQNIKINAQNKRIKKNLDLICANDISLINHGFNTENNALNLFWKDKEVYLSYSHKLVLSHRLLDEILKSYEKKNKY
ncbi:Coenzyme A biosynthesis bifunctional protein CoaBC [Candidatus Arsenophonus lipoptenae]|uniref:Coenzyme A biosynthesis bifunctional protein CoaBC n=1 Tax=Candidatus Arsenophonus lipoptenae TaxID=634113 RepID=A0A0X9VR56_9GAMM|nr:bifunctional phosphopantothenoylcysteine decarboxylase/phosphopantothenate--cysteine ligase CoaBC [Candidatus Arsenophonus lipoptenae]AMA64712.1 Coenzyme A biosynthesis bifunctional protein CoaBC [Candidatus Arsenophonus lipoptenae]